MPDLFSCIYFLAIVVGRSDLLGQMECLCSETDNL